MTDKFSGCTICGAPIIYHDSQILMTCSICGNTFPSNAECENHHYICDACHAKGGLAMVKSVCLSSGSKNPIEILESLMDLPGVHMHGPEHHVMVGSALLTAYSNAGGDLDLPVVLDEMRQRGSQVPGGVCGLWGTCGAAISCGMAYSIITGSSPLSEESWGRCNLLTSRCLAAIGGFGGPRCCKRDGYTAILTASEYIRETLGVELEVPESITCTCSYGNPQCLGKRCPYNG